jgi:hypothetical protein
MSLNRGRSRRTFVATLALSLALSAPAAAGDPPATDITVAGLRAGLTRVRGGDRPGDVRALGLSVTHVGFGLEGPFSVRAVNTGSLAGGDNGIEGGIGQAVAGGLRAPLGKNHGLVVRGGLEFGFFGNKYLWDSIVELPQLQLGYQWLVPRSVIDVAMKGGYVIVGRHNTGDAGSRDLDGSFEVGAIGALHIGPVDLRASYTSVRVRDGGSPVDLLEAAFCGHIPPAVLCTDVRYELGDVRLPGGSLSDTVASYVGLTGGIVLFANERKKR